MDIEKIKSYGGLILGTLIVLFGIYWFGKRQGKMDFPEFPMPGGGSSGKLSDEEKEKAEQIADDLYEELKGWSLNYDTEVYKNYAQQPERIFVAAYNIFNDKYYEDRQKSMKEWMESETSFFQYQLNTVVQGILDRMENLGME